MERADAPVRQARITADFRLPQIAALETVDEQRDGGRFGRTLGRAEMQAALTVQLVRHGRRQPVGQRCRPQVVLRHLHRMLIALIQQALAVQRLRQHHIHIRPHRLLGRVGRHKRAVGQLVIHGRRAAACRQNRQCRQHRHRPLPHRFHHLIFLSVSGLCRFG